MQIYFVLPRISVGILAWHGFSVRVPAGTQARRFPVRILAENYLPDKSQLEISFLAASWHYSNSFFKAKLLTILKYGNPVVMSKFLPATRAMGLSNHLHLKSPPFGLIPVGLSKNQKQETLCSNPKINTLLLQGFTLYSKAL